MEQKGPQMGAEGKVEVDFVDTVAILYMKCGENRINPSFVDKINKALDKVESNANIRALVTTGDPDSRFYCNGMDINYMAYHSQSEEGLAYLLNKVSPAVRDMWCRFLTFPMPTIAAMNGHAFAGGAILSLCHDYRMMRSDRGWWCLNEIFLGMYFAPYLHQLLRTKLTPKTLSDAAVFGTRYTGPEAVKHLLVDQHSSGHSLLSDARAKAKQLTEKQQYDRTSLHNMKADIYGKVLSAGLQARM